MSRPKAFCGQPEQLRPKQWKRPKDRIFARSTCCTTNLKRKRRVKQKQTKYLINNAYDPRTFLYAVEVRLLHRERQVDLRLLFDTGAGYSGISQVIFDNLGIQKSDNMPVTFGSGADNLAIGTLDSVI